jgi:hypothetical protein
MSYSLNILSGNPIGYWEFSGNTNDSINSNNFTSSSVSYQTPPIIANGGQSLKISYNSSASLSNSNGFVEALSKNFEDKTFTVGFWFSLDNQLNGSGYGTNPINPNNENRLSFFEVNSSSTNILKIYYDYISNTIRASIAGNNNIEAYAPIRIMDKQNFVLVTYSNGKILLNLNGIDGVQGFIYDKTIMSSFTKNQLSFLIPKSIYSSSQKINHYLISGLSFYDRIIKEGEILNIIKWGFNDGKPVNSSISTNKKSFTTSKAADLSDIISYNFSGEDFINRGIIYNLNSSKSGLIPKSIDNLIFSAGSSSYYISNINGISWSGLNYIQFPNFINYLKLYNSTITAQINRSSISSDYIFSISNVNGVNIYLLSGSSNYYLGYYDKTSGSSYTILSSPNSPTQGSANIGVTFLNNNIYLYTSDGGSASTSLDSNSPLYNISLSISSNLYIGNNINNLSSFSASIKNFGLSDLAITDFSYFNFTKNNKFMFKFTSSANPLTVSQYGYWQTAIPPINSTLIGTIVNWISMDNCQVFSSVDGGQTFSLLTKNSSVPNIYPGEVSKPIFFKIVINTDYTLGIKNQTFNNLNVIISKEMNHQTDLAVYNIIPITTPSTSNPVFKTNSLPITSNPSNFGIKMTNSGSLTPPYLYASTQYATHKAIEFWYRADSISGSLNIISTASGSSQEPYVYISSSSYLYHNASALYINGSAVVSGSYLMTKNVPYHIVTVLSASTNQNDFYLNGDPTKNTNSSSATYGFINIWEYTPTYSQIYNSYYSHISPNTYVVLDDNSSKIIPNINNDSVLAYKIG